MVWVGGKNRISLHILSPVALTAALDIVAVCTTQQAVMTMTQALNRRTPRIIPLTNNLVLRLMSQLTVYLFGFSRATPRPHSHTNIGRSLPSEDYTLSISYTSPIIITRDILPFIQSIDTPCKHCNAPRAR